MPVLSPRLSFALAAVLAAAAGCSSLEGRHRIPVGKAPGPLLLADGGRALISENLGDSTLSWIDLKTRREVARIHLPVPEKDRIADCTLDETTHTLWAVSSAGQIFSVDLETHEAQTRHMDAKQRFQSALWDPYTKRLLVATKPPPLVKGEPPEGGMLGRFDGKSIEESPWDVRGGVKRMALRGPIVYSLPGRDPGVGEDHAPPRFQALDPKTYTPRYEHDFEHGTPSQLAVPTKGPILVTTVRPNALDEFSPEAHLLAERRTGPFPPRLLAATDTRVLIGDGGEPSRPVLEYERSPTGLSWDLPALEYPIPEGEFDGLAALPGGGIAVSLVKRNEVLLLDSSEARPFSGQYR